MRRWWLYFHVVHERRHQNPSDLFFVTMPQTLYLWHSSRGQGVSLGLRLPRIDLTLDIYPMSGKHA